MKSIKKYLSTLLIVGLSSSGMAQYSHSVQGSFVEINGTSVQLLPNGTTYVFGHGSVGTPTDLNSLKSSDGVNWNYTSTAGAVSWPDGYLAPIASHFFDVNNGLVLMTQDMGGYEQPRILKTSDGGLSWTNQFSLTYDSGADGFVDMAFSDNNTGIAIVSRIDDGPIFLSSAVRTTDGGNTWTELSTTLTNVAFEKITEINGVFYVLGTTITGWDADGWVVYKSTDNGDSWVEMSGESLPISSSGSNGFDIQFISSTVGYIAFHEYPGSYVYSTIMKTVDGGATWSDLPSTSGALSEKMDINVIRFIDEMNGIIIAGNHCDNSGCYRGWAVLSTNNGGLNWDLVAKASGGPYALHDFQFDENLGYGYAVGGNIGTGQCRIHKISMDGAGQVSMSSSEISAYPNPTQNGLVYFDLPNGKEYTLQLFSIDGKLVNSTSVSLDENVVKLPYSGMFIYRLITEDQVIEGRVTKI